MFWKKQTAEVTFMVVFPERDVNVNQLMYRNIPIRGTLLNRSAPPTLGEGFSWFCKTLSFDSEFCKTLMFTSDNGRNKNYLI